jgi:hypothetical protein
LFGEGLPNVVDIEVLAAVAKELRPEVHAIAGAYNRSRYSFVKNRGHSRIPDTNGTHAHENAKPHNSRNLLWGKNLSKCARQDSNL